MQLLERRLLLGLSVQWIPRSPKHTLSGKLVSGGAAAGREGCSPPRALSLQPPRRVRQEKSAPPPPLTPLPAPKPPSPPPPPHVRPIQPHGERLPPSPAAGARVPVSRARLRHPWQGRCGGTGTSFHHATERSNTFRFLKHRYPRQPIQQSIYSLTGHPVASNSYAVFPAQPPQIW